MHVSILVCDRIVCPNVIVGTEVQTTRGTFGTGIAIRAGKLVTNANEDIIVFGNPEIVHFPEICMSRFSRNLLS